MPYDNSPKGYFFFPAVSAVNFRQGMTVIDDLMTELCKSFSPLKKLSRGLLMHFVLSLLSHLAFVKDTQHHKMLDPLQEPIIFRSEMFNRGHSFNILFISLFIYSELFKYLLQEKYNNKEILVQYWR